MSLEQFESYQGIKKFAKEKGVMVAITYNCDCSCKHCGVKSYHKPDAQELSTIEIKEKIIDRLKGIGFNVICFFGGEPTLHKDFIELIRYASAKGIYARFDTNGHKLSNLDFVKEIKDAGVGFVLVSIDSATAEVHDRFRGMKGSWEKAIQAIHNCVKTGIPVGISTVVTKQNLRNEDFKRVIQLGKELGVFKIRALTPIMVGRWYQQDIKLSADELRELHSLLEPNFVFWEEWCDGTVPFVCCSITRWFFFISLYGDVQPCCYIPIRFGNIRDQDLKSVVNKMWSSSYFQLKKSNINRCDCPMNNENVRKKIARLSKEKGKLPFDYNETIFSAE
ncbi:radical SAM/SPASM domain-containing protein [Candidatus Omnitrophota bacterium]